MITNAIQIQGWMSEGELLWLAEQAKEHKKIVEVGSYLGRSTMALCDNTSGFVYSIDPYKGEYRYDDGRVMMSFDDDIMSQFINNLKHHFESGKLYHRRNTLPYIEFDFSPDFIFLDGDHRESAVRSDIVAALYWTKKGGIIAGHDYDHKDWPSVKKVVDEFFPQVNLVESIWWIRKS